MKKNIINTEILLILLSMANHNLIQEVNSYLSWDPSIQQLKQYGHRRCLDSLLLKLVDLSDSIIVDGRKENIKVINNLGLASTTDQLLTKRTFNNRLSDTQYLSLDKGNGTLRIKYNIFVNDSIDQFDHIVNLEFNNFHDNEIIQITSNKDYIGQGVYADRIANEIKLCDLTNNIGYLIKWEEDSGILTGAVRRSSWDRETILEVSNENNRVSICLRKTGKNKDKLLNESIKKNQEGIKLIETKYQDFELTKELYDYHRCIFERTITIKPYQH